MTLGDPLDQAMTFIRNTAAGSPRFGDQWEVMSIDGEPHRRDRLHLHLSNGANIRVTVSVDVPPVLTPSPEFPPGHPRSAWPTVELADGPDLPAAIDEVYSTTCPECGVDVDHLCMTRETADILPENTPHIARVLATTIIDSAWQEPTAHPALRAKWDAYQAECASVFGIPGETEEDDPICLCDGVSADRRPYRHCPIHGGAA